MSVQQSKVMVSRNTEQAFKVLKLNDEDSRGGCSLLQSQKMFMRICVAAYCGDDVPGQCVISVVDVHFFTFFQY